MVVDTTEFSEELQLVSPRALKVDGGVQAHGRHLQLQ